MSTVHLIPACVLALVVAAGLATFRLVLGWLAHRREQPLLVKVLLQATAGAMAWPLVALLGIAAGVWVLAVEPQAAHVTKVSLVALTLVTLGRICTGVPGTFALRRIEERGNDPRMLTIYRVGSFLLGTLIWTAILLVVLDTAGADVTALVASAGIGGVAVALAAQGLVGDLLASCVIVLDRPFEIGDRLRFGEVEGEVQSVGVKTTRMLTTSGEVLVCPNALLLSQMIRNLGGEVKDRAGTIRVPVMWNTPAEMLCQLLRAVPLLHVSGVESMQVQLDEPSDFSLWVRIEFASNARTHEMYEQTRGQVLLAVLGKCEELQIGVGRPGPGGAARTGQEMRGLRY